MSGFDASPITSVGPAEICGGLASGTRVRQPKFTVPMEDYFDPHDILCEEQRVKIRFSHDVPWGGMRSLPEELQITDSLISKGTVLEVPLWMARPFLSSGVATILMPRQFGTRVRADLAAGADAVSLKDLSSYWYRFGMKTGRLLPNENISKLCKAALAGRLGFISKGVFSNGDRVCDPHNSLHGAPNHGSFLDFEEAIIFSETIASRKDCDQWLARNHTKLRANDVYNTVKY